MELRSKITKEELSLIEYMKTWGITTEFPSLDGAWTNSLEKNIGLFETGKLLFSYL